MSVRKGFTGRKFNMSNTGVDPVESSDAEEELPPHPSATTGSTVFAGTTNEIKNTRQDAPSITDVTAASRNRFGPDLLAQASIHTWIPESHPADGTEVHAARKKASERSVMLICAQVQMSASQGILFFSIVGRHSIL